MICRKHVTFVCLLALLLTRPALSQEQTSPSGSPAANKVLVVIVQGNEKTKEEIILREMKLKPGDLFTEETLEADRLRIQNLGIFNRVQLEAIPTNNGSILVVTVWEMWYIFPYPIFFRNDRDWGRLSVGAGVRHINFRGRREGLDLQFWLGFNPAIRFSYSNPWIFGKLKLYTSFSIAARKRRSLFFDVQDIDVNEKYLAFNWRIGKRFGHFTYFDVSLGYRQLTLSRDDVGGTLSPDGKDKLPSMGISFLYDSRDLGEYAHRGNYLWIWGTKTGWTDHIDYGRYGTDIRKYFPIGVTTLAVRGAANLSSGVLPSYDNVHIGFGTRIRGHFSERASGENMLLGNAEFRFPIRKITYHNWGPFQSMGRYGANLRFGISGGVFVDTGALWAQNADLVRENFVTGWGAGLHFFLPYNNLLRLEYAFDEDWNGQLIFDALMIF